MQSCATAEFNSATAFHAFSGSAIAVIHFHFARFFRHGYVAAMTTAQEIEQAIEKLPEDEYVRFAAWFERRRAEEAREAEEDREDLEAARRSLAEPGENIPFEKLAKELGL